MTNKEKLKVCDDILTLVIISEIIVFAFKLIIELFSWIFDLTVNEYVDKLLLKSLESLIFTSTITIVAASFLMLNKINHDR